MPDATSKRTWAETVWLIRRHLYGCSGRETVELYAQTIPCPVCCWTREEVTRV